MRIAQIAPLFESVPPKLYGGTERIVSHLTDYLVGAGHEVTLFASGDSITNTELIPVWPHIAEKRPDRAIRIAIACDLPLRIAAKQAAAALADQLGMEERAQRLRGEAEALRERFESVFWCDDLSTYALALDGNKKPCRVVASNAGHCLYAGIASAEHARQTAATLMGSSCFSGWGIRTVALHEKRYNPMSYHNGSIWPHDNAIVAAGLARYGMKELCAKIMNALFEAAGYFDLYRLPELFCGFTRRPEQAPTLYPVACSPQAWAAGSV